MSSDRTQRRRAASASPRHVGRRWRRRGASTRPTSTRAARPSRSGCSTRAARSPASACSSSRAAPAASASPRPARRRPAARSWSRTSSPAMTAIAAARAEELGLTNVPRAVARPRGDRRARRLLRRRAVPRGPDVRARPGRRGARDRAACCAPAAGPRSRSGDRASATPGSGWCSTRSARRSGAPVPPPGRPGPVLAGGRRPARRPARRRRPVDVARRGVPGAAARAPRSTSGGSRARSLAGPLAKVLAALPEEAAERAARASAGSGGRLRDRERPRAARRDPAGLGIPLVGPGTHAAHPLDGDPHPHPRGRIVHRGKRTSGPR